MTKRRTPAKKTPKRNSNRIRNKSLRQKESEEYLLAVGDIEDISDGTKDIRADNSILEDVPKHKEACGGISSEVIEVVTETPCCFENGSEDIMVSGEKISSADIVSDIVSGIVSNVVSDEQNMRDVIMKVDGMTLLSLPEGVRGYDDRYVKDISFAVDGGENRQWKQLSSMGDLYDHNPELFHMLFDWTLNSGAMVENNVESCKNASNHCAKCINLEKVKNEREKLIQEKGELASEVKKLSSMALDLNNELKKRDIRIRELGTSDRDKREMERLERIIEISDDRAECLERKVESSLLEIAALNESLQYYMDENVRLKNAAKVKNNCPIDDKTVVEHADVIKPVPKPMPASSLSPNLSIDSDISEWSVSLMGIGTVVDKPSNNNVRTNDNTSTSATNADISIVEVFDEPMNRKDTDICEVVTLMGLGTVVNSPSNDDQPTVTTNESVMDFKLSNDFSSSVDIEKKVARKRVCNERTVSTTSQDFHHTMPPTSSAPPGPTFMPPTPSMPLTPTMPSKPPMPPMPSIPQMPPMPPIPSVSTLFSMPTITPMPMRANNIEVSDNKWLLPGMPFNHSSGIIPPHPPMSNITSKYPSNLIAPKFEQL